MAGKKQTDSKALTLDSLQQIAQVLKSNGTDGELVISFRNIDPEDINLEEPVFIIFDGLPVPFYIESLTKRGQTKALVHLTGIRCQEDVDEISSKAVYIHEAMTQGLSLEDDGFAALIGWIVLTDSINQNESPSSCNDNKTDTEHSFCSDSLYEVGEITDFIDIPNNPCIEVETKNGAVMIPLHEDLVLSIDPENQEIIMTIPDGLI